MYSFKKLFTFLFLLQVVARKLIKEGKGGAIVNVSSTVSRIGQANHFPYGKF